MMVLNLIIYVSHSSANPAQILRNICPGDLKSAVRAGYQTQRCSMMSHIIKATWPVKSVHTAGLTYHMQQIRAITPKTSEPKLQVPNHVILATYCLKPD